MRRHHTDRAHITSLARTVIGGWAGLVLLASLGAADGERRWVPTLDPPGWPRGFGPRGDRSYPLPNPLPLGRSPSLVARDTFAGYQCLCADINGDHQVETVTWVAPNRLVARDSRLRALWEYRSANEWIHSFVLADVTGDGVAEVLVSGQFGGKWHLDIPVTEVSRLAAQGKRTILEVLDGQGRVVRHVTDVPLGYPCRPEEQLWAYKALASADLDGDGQPELLTFVDVGRAHGRPRKITRRVVALDTRTWRPRWAFDYPLMIGSPTCGDLDGDGRLEVLIDGYAQANGARCGGRDDDHCYLALLDSDGRELWVREMAPELAGTDFGEALLATRSSVADLDGDGRPEIATLVCSALGNRPDYAKISVLDTNGIEGVSRVSRHHISELSVADVDADGRPEIVCSGSDGRLLVFDGRLKQEDQVDLPYPCALGLVADLDGDKAAEVIATMAGEHLALVDLYPAERVWWLNVPAGSVEMAGDVDGDGATEIVTRRGARAPAMTMTAWEVVAAAAPEVATEGEVLDCGDSKARVVAWSPDGWRALVATRGGMRLADLQSSRLTSFSMASTKVAGVRWSRDGETLWALERGQGGRVQVSVAHAPGFRLEPVLSAAGLADFDPAPDGSRVAYASRGHLYLYDCTTRQARLVPAASTVGTADHPRWSPDGAFLSFVRETASRLRGASASRQDLCSLDVVTGACQELTPAGALVESVGKGAWWFLGLERDDGPLPLEDMEARRLEPEVAESAWSPDSSRILFAARVFGATVRGDPAAAWTDLWVANVATHSLARATTLPHVERQPRWSAHGHYFGYLFHPNYDYWSEQEACAHPPVLAISRGPQLPEATIGSADAFSWLGDGEDEVALLREGKILRVKLKEPDIGPAKLPNQVVRQRVLRATYAAFGSGAILVIGLIALRPIQRGRRAWLLLVAATRAARLGFDPPTLRRLVGLFAELDNTLHSLKNAVFLISAADGVAVGLEDVEFCLDPENMRAIEGLSRAALEQIDRLARDENLFRQAVSDFSGRTRDAFGRAIDGALDRRAALQRGLERVARHAGELERYRKFEGEAQREAIGRAAADLNELYNLIDGPEGVRRHVLRALESVTLDGALGQAAQVMSRRAAEVGVKLSVPPEGYRTRVCGDPTPLVDVFVGVLANALDALEKQREAAGPAFVPQLSITLDGTSPVAVRISDNGCGIPEGVLRQLRSGVRVTTKQAGRGTGLARAREVLLRRYPQSALEIESAGEGKGAEVRITVGTA